MLSAAPCDRPGGHTDWVVDDWTVVPAHDLTIGRVIEVDGEPGSWAVEGLYLEGREVVVVRLLPADDEAGGHEYEWHLSADHFVRTRPMSAT